MKRDWLKSLGLAEDIVNKVMDENGKDIEKQKVNGDAYKLQLEQLQKAQKETEQKMLADKKEAAIELALYKAGAIDNQLVKSKLHCDMIVPNEEGVFSGVEEQIHALKNEYTFLFKPEETKVDIAGVIPAQNTTTPERDPFLQGFQH